MMKKALVVFGLAAVVALPNVALAAKAQPQTFAASGSLCLTALPTSATIKVNKKHVRLFAEGEVFTGAIDNSPQWAGLVGAPVTVDVDKERARFNLTTLTYTGNISGTITINDAGDPLTGKFQGQTGGAFLDPSDPTNTVYATQAAFKFQLKDSQDRARGEGEALFIYDISSGTFCGPLGINGTVTPRPQKGNGGGGNAG